MTQADNTTTPNRISFSSAGAVRRRPFPVEIPQEPRFAVQRLVEDEWRTITFNDGAFDDPYDGRPLLYASRYVAEHISRAYSREGETVRVHEIPPTRTFTLSTEQADALAEMCTLTAYSGGYLLTPEMVRVSKFIADRFSSIAARRACLARAADEEHQVAA